MPERLMERPPSEQVEPGIFVKQEEIPKPQIELDASGIAQMQLTSARKTLATIEKQYEDTLKISNIGSPLRELVKTQLNEARRRVEIWEARVQSASLNSIEHQNN